MLLSSNFLYQQSWTALSRAQHDLSAATSSPPLIVADYATRAGQPPMTPRDISVATRFEEPFASSFVKLVVILNHLAARG
jgi:hypothetical protein